MGQFESLLWERSSARAGRYRSRTSLARRETNPLAEWTARPLGRLGRPLLLEIESYLEFFAIARTDGAGLDR